jgi:RimJ/RimL family protein N-acetyltransferase
VIDGARAAPPVLELDGLRWREATPADAAHFERLVASTHADLAYGLPVSETALREALNRPGLRHAMLCTRGSRVVGAAATRNRNQQSQNLQLIGLFVRPAGVGAALAMYVRHLFWTMPLHRVYAQFPAVAGAAGRERLLRGAGFAYEGRLAGHALIGGRPRDLLCYGLLRRDFDRWCLENEPRLAL